MQAVPRTRKKNLGNNASISSNGQILAKKQKKRVEKFRLLGAAKKILNAHYVKSPTGKNRHRTRLCHSNKARNAQNITIKLSHDDLQSEASFGHVQTCGCVWACPVCYEREAIKKGNQIKKAIDCAQAVGLTPIMVALTASHGPTTPLAEFEEKFKKSWRTFNSHRSWRNFKEDFCVEHHIANVDTTYTANGWHYHKHILLFVDLPKRNRKKIVAEIDEKLTNLWLNCVSANGLSADAEHGLKISAHSNASADYLAKIGLTENHGLLEYEMTSSDSKNSRTIWDILRHASHGDKNAERLYIEYVTHMTGKNWITWSHGLREIVADFEAENEQPEPEPEKFTDWLIIPDYWWSIVKWANGGYARLLDTAARTRDVKDVKYCLVILREELADDNRLPQYYRKFVPESASIGDVRIHEDWKIWKTK